MVKKNISLVLSLFVISSLTSSCGMGRETITSVPENKEKTVAPASENVINTADNTPVNEQISTSEPTKEQKDIKILTILANEGLALTEEGLKVAGITFTKNIGSFYTKAKEVNFYTELWDLGGFKDGSKERAAKIAEMKLKYPNYFLPIAPRLCYVYYPKFRYCNPDGS